MTPNGRKAARPFTARSLVGMSQSARKRKARSVAFVVINSVTFFEHAVPLASALHERLYRERGFPRHSEEMMRVRDVRAKYRIGKRLRPCLGCCACWGCEQDPTRINPVSGNTLHWAGPKRKHTFECPMGPPLAGKKSKQIARMLKWQETLPDDCDGSGVLPATKAKRPE